MSLPRKAIDWKRYDAHHADGGTDAAFARSLGMDPRNFHQYKQSRHKDEAPEHTSGIPAVSPMSHPEYTAVAPVTPVSPVVTPHGIPDLARQSDLDTLRQRVEVLEAFIATFQQRGIPVSPNGVPYLTSGIPVSPNGVPYLTSGIPVSPTTKHSFVIAVDLLAAIQRYAAVHHAQVKDALDYLVRTGLAAVGEEVDADA